ncbi:MAG: FAD-binding oxidoreductase [Pseudomonadota bacterium]
MTGFLDANDPGRFPESWYAASDPEPAPRPSLSQNHRADVAVIGAGYAGLSAALHLAEAGLSVTVLEANRVGWGASGRNGGQLGAAPRQDIDWYEATLGLETAKKIYALAVEANTLARTLIARHGIECQLKDGILDALHSRRYVAAAEAYARRMRGDYDVEDVRYLDRDETAAATGSGTFFGGVLNTRAAHLHPLRYARGLAYAAEAAGAQIYEASRVRRIDGAEGLVTTDGAEIRADFIVLAVNGYHDGIENRTASRVVPINNFIIATEPLGERFPEILPGDIAVADTRFVVNYFRLSPDRRMLFGGGESHSKRFPANLKTFVRPHMLKLYPQLAEVRVDYGWGGTLGITPTRAPVFLRAEKRVLSIGGWSGSGVHMATLGGKIAAEAIRGTTERFDLLSSVPAPAFPGGQTFRAPLLRLALTYYGLLDRL